MADIQNVDTKMSNLHEPCPKIAKKKRSIKPYTSMNKRGNAY